MDKIEVRVLNPEAIAESEQMMVCAARLTQRGHKIKNLDDFMALYNSDYKNETVKNMTTLPHPTIQKFGVINVVVVGASRRFLAQITRHQNEVKFMSASLQYSNYEDKTAGDNFVIPYKLLDHTVNRAKFLEACEAAMTQYKDAVAADVDNDSAGYMAPQALRNVLIISATPYQWKHMIAQRVCRRNTDETRYVMLRIWEHLCAASLAFNCPEMFSNTGPLCMKTGTCPEGKMSCGKKLSKGMTPTEILKEDFPLCSDGGSYCTLGQALEKIAAVGFFDGLIAGLSGGSANEDKNN